MQRAAPAVFAGAFFCPSFLPNKAWHTARKASQTSNTLTPRSDGSTRHSL